MVLLFISIISFCRWWKRGFIVRRYGFQQVLSAFYPWQSCNMQWNDEVQLSCECLPIVVYAWLNLHHQAVPDKRKLLHLTSRFIKAWTGKYHLLPTLLHRRTHFVNCDLLLVSNKPLFSEFVTLSRRFSDAYDVSRCAIDFFPYVLRFLVCVLCEWKVETGNKVEKFSMATFGLKSTNFRCFVNQQYR